MNEETMRKRRKYRLILQTMFDSIEKIIKSSWLKYIIAACFFLGLRKLASQASQVLSVSPTVDQCNPNLPILSETHNLMAKAALGDVTVAGCKMVTTLNTISFIIVALVALGLAWHSLHASSALDIEK